MLCTNQERAVLTKSLFQDCRSAIVAARFGYESHFAVGETVRSHADPSISFHLAYIMVYYSHDQTKESHRVQHPTNFAQFEW